MEVSAPMWNSGTIDRLHRAAAALDQETGARLVDELVQAVRATARPTADQQKQVLDDLRSARWFSFMQMVGAVLDEAKLATPRARRQYAQALIEQGVYEDALAVLEALVTDGGTPPEEKAESKGLVGRVYKQVYVERFAALGPMRRSTLEASIKAYYDVYASGRNQFMWQGINAVALVMRGRRDKLEVAAPEEADAMAKHILQVASKSVASWDLATSAEACVALGMWKEAAEYINAYIQHPAIDSFACASTLRQLRQVWQLKEGSEGGDLITLLQPAVLRPRPDAHRPGVAQLGAGLSLAAGELSAASAGVVSSGPQLERVFGSVGPRSFEWYRTGIERAKAVARIETPFGKGFGTGFLAKAGQLFQSLANSDELLLVTNSHVLGNLDPLSLRAPDAVVRWEAVDTARRLGVKEILFESPPAELDVTVARLDAAVVGVEACPIGPREEPIYDPDRVRQLYVIGHPDGGGLTISLDDNLEVGWKRPLLHYRTPTNPGSSGSPVFDDAWRLIAVHHAGSDAMPRLDGHPGTYQANEGIWIHAVLDAIAQHEQRRGQVESAAPAVRPAFRRGIFVSYSHSDAAWLERILVRLTPLARARDLEVWSDRKIAAGSNWSTEIERQLDTACVAVLLVSPNFVASDFITATELPRLLDASAKRGLTVVPIAIASSNYEYIRELAALQFANDPKHPLNELTDGARDAALTEIVKKVDGALDLARMSNQFKAMDAVAYKQTGLGGNTPAEVGLSGLAVKAVQVDERLSLQTKNGELPVADVHMLQRLDTRERALIGTFDATIQDLFERWTDMYPHHLSRDPRVRERAKPELLQIRTDLCTQLNALLDFYAQLGAPIQDHYQAIRYICASNFKL